MEMVDFDPVDRKIVQGCSISEGVEGEIKTCRLTEKEIKWAMNSYHLDNNIDYLILILQFRTRFTVKLWPKNYNINPIKW